MFKFQYMICNWKDHAQYMPFTWIDGHALLKHDFRHIPYSGFQQALENQERKFHAWKNHGILKNLNNRGKIMEICEII